MLNNIAVIPLYIGMLQLTDKKKDITWREQVYIGLDYAKAHEAVKDAREHWLDSVAELKSIIRYYHIKADGTMVYLIETKV